VYRAHQGATGLPERYPDARANPRKYPKSLTYRRQPRLSASELGLRIASFAMELLGPFGQLESGQFAVDRGLWARRMLEARGPMIYSGTNEIQRNILAERVLGLPKG
jgi:alkylation response protein AidB-like acyl-CoA dehydrogenase